MNAEKFLANFEHIANAPGGVKSLRDTILQLAVSGRLVLRSAKVDEVDSDIASAASLKKTYRDKLDLRPMEADRTITDDEKLFSIPGHWRWVRLGNIACYIQRGKGPKYDPAGRALVVSQKCIQWSGFDLTVARKISEDSLEAYSEERWLVKGDILWNSTGTGTVGRVVEYPGSSHAVVTDSHVTVIRLTNFIPAFVRLFLSSPCIQRLIEPGVEKSLVTGTTNQVELSTTQVRDLPLPCPCVAEQKDIVARVDELMALCDRMEAQQQERERTFPIFSRVAHALVTEAPTISNLHRIFDEVDRSAPIDIRKTILNFAIHGRLSSRQASDGSVETSLPELASRVVKSEGNRYPTHWAQAKLGDLGEWKGGGTPSKSVSEYWTGTMPWVSPKDMKQLRISDAQDHISKSAIEGSAVQLIPENSLLMVVRGMILGRAFPVALTTRRVTINQDMKALLPHAPSMSEFLLLALRAFEPSVLASIERSSHGTCKLLTEVLHSFEIPIPPLAEQRRIVGKVDELMAMVDHLEFKQEQRDQLAEAFAKACVASFTGTTNIERPEKMKAPKTELVSLVSLGKKPKAGADAPLAAILIKQGGELSAKALWQQSGLTIDAFYQQLKIEIVQGWVARPMEAEMKVLEES